MTIANADMAAAWDEEGVHWAVHADHYEQTSRRFWDRLVAAVPAGPGDGVLDVGCGTGGSSRDLAQRAHTVLGVDLSEPMLEAARARAAAEGLANVGFERADAQVHPFPEHAFDLAVSRFGAMFFADPVAAFANIRRALRPGGRLALLVWRELDRNEWVGALRGALAAGRTLPVPPPDAPGPFGLARREHTERVLTDAGFGDVVLTEVAEPVWYGRDLADATAFVGTLGVVRGLTAELSDADRAAALDTVRETLAAHETPDGVLLGGSAWLVTARA